MPEGCQWPWSKQIEFKTAAAPTPPLRYKAARTKRTKQAGGTADMYEWHASGAIPNRPNGDPMKLKRGLLHRLGTFVRGLHVILALALALPALSAGAADVANAGPPTTAELKRILAPDPGPPKRRWENVLVRDCKRSAEVAGAYLCHLEFDVYFATGKTPISDSGEYLFKRNGATWTFDSLRDLKRLEVEVKENQKWAERANRAAERLERAAQKAVARKAFTSEAHPLYLAGYALASLLIAVFLWRVLPRVPSKAWTHRGDNGIGDMPHQFVSNKIADGPAVAAHNLAASVSPSAALGLIGLILGAVGVVVGGFVIPDAFDLFNPKDGASLVALAFSAVVWGLTGMRCLALVMKRLPWLISLGVLAFLIGAIFGS